jgi:hypothetical protein
MDLCDLELWCLLRKVMRSVGEFDLFWKKCDAVSGLMDCSMAPESQKVHNRKFDLEKGDMLLNSRGRMGTICILEVN